MGALGAIGDGMSTNVLLLFASRIMNSLGGGNNNNSETSMSEVEKVSF
jgi:ATP-binding cassette subfamily B (MDR/TAP) protein 1